MSIKRTLPLIPDEYIRFIFGIIVFSALISGGTYYLQSSLTLLKAFGLFAHWGTILILLPVLSGLVQHLIAPPAKLLVPILGGLASSIILYPLYAERFWAIPPSFTDVIFFTLAVVGIGFTSSINPLDRHVKQRRISRCMKKTSRKNESHLQIEPNEDGLEERFLNSSIVRTF